MSSLTVFLKRLLQDGRILLEPGAWRGWDDSDLDNARALLRRSYVRWSLDMPGPSMPFDETIALGAGQILFHASRAFALTDHASWQALNAGRPRLGTPSLACEHASADVSLRFLPDLHRRALAAIEEPSDPFLVYLSDLLRRWPLSGASASIDDPPTSSLEFDGHRGLRMLYAERLLHSPTDKFSWIPSGDGWEVLRWVAAAEGLENSPLVLSNPRQPRGAVTP